MQDQWIYSSSFVPYTGEPIEFRLEEREQSINGTFADDAFHSRWADYDRSRVGSWRSLHEVPSEAPLVAPASTTGSFARLFNRLKNTFSRNHGIDPIAPPCDRTTTAPMVAIALPRNRAIKRSIDSNQMSS